MAERSRKECKYERSKVKGQIIYKQSRFILEFGIEGKGRDVREREGVLFPNVLYCEAFLNLRCPFRLMWDPAISYT